MGGWGDGGMGGQGRQGRQGGGEMGGCRGGVSPPNECPMPHAQCPMPNAQVDEVKNKRQYAGISIKPVKIAVDEEV
jgi:hypothetical protein